MRFVESGVESYRIYGDSCESRRFSSLQGRIADSHKAIHFSSLRDSALAESWQNKRERSFL